MWPLAFAVLLAGLWPPAPGANRDDERTTRDTALDDGAPTQSDRVLRDPGARAAEIVRLGTLGSPGDLRRIAVFVNSGDASLRLAAARVLVRAGDAETLARLGAQAAETSAPQRFEALTVLREAASLPVAGRRAAERALADTDPAMRLVALDLLTAHPSADSVTAVAGSLADGNRDVRLSAIGLLGRTPDARALMPLLERSDTPDRTERVAVLQALGGFAHVHPRLEAGPAVLQQVSDVNEDVQVAAIDALGRLRWVPAVPVLRTLAARSVDERPARRATLALGEIGDTTAVAALVELLRDPAPAEPVLVALRRAGRAAVKALAAVLGDGFSTSAMAAAALLGDLGDVGAAPALARALKARPTVAISAARALGKLRDPDTVAALIEAVASPVYAKAPGVREACLVALAAIGDPRAASVVRVTADDPEPRIRAAALDLAAVLHAGLSRTSLTARLQDRQPVVRVAAIKAVASFPDLDVGPELMHALPPFGALDRTARARVCPALARARLPAADAYLSTLLAHDPDDGVRASAAWAAQGRRDTPAIAAALGRARQTDVVPVAANAAAAIAGPDPDTDAGDSSGQRRSAARRASWAAVRAISPGGFPAAGKWLRIRAGQHVVWARTDDSGEALVTALPSAGPYQISLGPEDHDVLTAATASGRSPATTPVEP